MVVTGELDGQSLSPQKMETCQMQGIKGANWMGKNVQGTFEDSGCQLQQSDATDDSASRITMGFVKIACVQSSPDLVLDQASGDKSCAPKSVRRAIILGQKVSESHGSAYVDHRSLRSPSNSAPTSFNAILGSGTGGVPTEGRSGGVNQPFRTASARTGLLVSRGGPISATTRSRSVTRMVSPLAAMRTYSLSRLLRTLIPTDLTHSKVVTSCYCVKDAASGKVCEFVPDSTDSAKSSPPRARIAIGRGRVLADHRGRSWSSRSAWSAAGTDCRFPAEEVRVLTIQEVLVPGAGAYRRWLLVAEFVFNRDSSEA